MAAFCVDPRDPLPLYYQVYSSLLQRMRAREFPAGATLPPERQLALDYSVSRITVTRALDELAREGYIDQRQGRGTFVLEAAVESPTADGHAIRGSVIGLIGHHWTDPYPFDLVSGILKETIREGYTLQIGGHVDDLATERQLIESVLRCGAAGLIIFPASGFGNADLYAQLCAREFPFVLMDRYSPQIETDRVLFDDEATGYELTMRLIAQGHRRIAVIDSLEVDVTSIRDRLIGYRRALDESGIPYAEDLVWLHVSARVPWWRDATNGHRAMRDHLAALLRQCLPTALLTLNHETAETVTEYLASLKLEKGNEADGSLPVASDLEIATISHMPAPRRLSLVSWYAYQSGERLGTEASRLLLDRMSGNVTGPFRSLCLPMEIAAMRPSPMLRPAAA